MLEISGKRQTFDLTGEAPARGRSYILVDLNFATLRKFFKSNTYDVISQTGEQREPIQKRVNHLRNEISNENYTPASFAASIISEDQAVVTYGKGKDKDKAFVTVTLDENKKLALLDGGQRFTALEILANDKPETARKVDNLPIPLILHLNPEKRKTDFINLNAGCPINRSQLLNMKLDQGLVDPKKTPYFKNARKLALHLHKSEDSPFHRLITFDGSSIAPLSFSAIATDRKGDGITTLFYSSKILEAAEKSESWFYEQVNFVDDFIKKNTVCGEEGNLLCVNGARGCSNLMLGVINQWCYYLYLHSRDKVKPVDIKVLKDGLKQFEQPVAGNLSSTRRKNLMRDFAQILFESIADDADSPIACHFGIPLGLLILTSASSFGVENPPVPLTEKKGRGRKSKVQPKAESVQPSNVLMSDTDEEWHD